MTFDLPPENGPARDAVILDHIARADYQSNWALVLATSPKGRAIVLEMMADALAINSVRINVSAALAQTIADRLGCLLPTPKIADLLYLSAKARGPVLMPSPQVITSSTAAMVDHSRRIDAALSRLALPPAVDGAAPVQTVGKHWVITNGLLSHPGKACNYGWHVAGAAPRSSWAGIYVDYAVTPGLGVIQAPGFAHDAGHSDYSQILQLVHGRCTVDGVDTDLRQALQDPDLSAALSHEGPLQILRQPGITAQGQVADPGGHATRTFWRQWGPAASGAALGFAAAGPPGAMAGAAAGLGLDWTWDTLSQVWKRSPPAGSI